MNEDEEEDEDEEEETQEFLNKMHTLYVFPERFRNINFENFNDFYTCKQCLEFIYLISEDLNLINKKYIKVFCTACLYFMIVVRCDGLKNLNLYFNFNGKEPFHKHPIKCFMFNLCLNCVNFSSKVCTNNQMYSVQHIFDVGKGHLSNFFRGYELRNVELDRVLYNLQRAYVISGHCFDFIEIVDDPIKTLNLLTSKKIKSLDAIITMYKNPNFCLFSTYEKCLFLISSLSSIKFNDRLKNMKNMKKMLF